MMSLNRRGAETRRKCSGRNVFVALRLCGCLLALATPARAQDRLTLEEAIARALQHNFDIRSAQNTLQQAQESNDWGAAGAFPTVGLSGGANGGITNTQINFADGRTQERRGARQYTITGTAGFDWTVYDGGRVRITKRQLETLEELEDARLKLQAQTVVSQVVQAYAAAVFQKQQGIAIDTGLVLARTRMVLSQAKFELGASAKVDFLQARVDMNARQSDSLAQEAALVRANADIAALLAEPSEKVYDVDDTLALALDLRPAQPELLQQNPSLLVARRTADVSLLEARLAKTERLPFLGINGGYNYTRTQSQAGFALFNRSVGPTAGLQLNIPLYQGGAIRRTIAITSLEAARNELLYARQNTEVGRQYRQAWANYSAAVASYRLEAENIGYAKENLDIQKARFRLGVATTLETREAENGYVAALVRLYNAGYNVKVGEVRVLELEGRLVE